MNRGGWGPLIPTKTIISDVSCSTVSYEKVCAFVKMFCKNGWYLVHPLCPRLPLAEAFRRVARRPPGSHGSILPKISAASQCRVVGSRKASRLRHDQLGRPAGGRANCSDLGFNLRPSLLLSGAPLNLKVSSHCSAEVVCTSTN